MSPQLEVWRLTCGSVTFPKSSLQMEVWRLQAALSRYQQHLYMWKRHVYMWQRHVSKGISTDGNGTFATLLYSWENDVYQGISTVEVWHVYERVCSTSGRMTFTKASLTHGRVVLQKASMRTERWRLPKKIIKNHVRWICDVLKRMMSDGNVTFPKRSLVYFCTIGFAWLSRR